MAQGQLGCHIGQWISRGLGGQSTAAAQPGVHLDDAELGAVRVHGVLDVALSNDAWHRPTRNMKLKHEDRDPFDA